MMVDQPLKTSAPQLWRGVEAEPYWVYERRRRRLRLLTVTIVGVALIVAGLAALLVTKARAEYVAGQRALAAGHYELAIRRFGAAKVIGRPYADAHALLNDAVALSSARSEYVAALDAASQPTAATLTFRRAAALFQSGRYAAAQALLADLPSRVPAPVAARLATSSNAAAGILLLVGARQAFAAHEWRIAGEDAAGVLTRYPHCDLAASLAAEAARRVRAAPLAQQAAALAAAHRWAAAGKIVRRALRIDPAYPGAAVLLGRIDAALARRKAATAAKAKAAASAAKAAASTPTVTPPAPVVSRPTPKPPPPP